MTGRVLPAMFEVRCLMICDERDNAGPEPAWCIEAFGMNPAAPGAVTDMK
jgi:hypothetical protein